MTPSFVCVIHSDAGLQTDFNALTSPSPGQLQAPVAFGPTHSVSIDEHASEFLPCVKCSCKVIVRLMSELCKSGWQKLKRMGRYLTGVPLQGQPMERQSP